MILVFKFYKKEGKWKQNVCPDFWQGLVALNLTMPAIPTIGHLQFSPLRPRILPDSNDFTLIQELRPGFSEPTSVFPLRGTLTDR